MDSKQFNEDKKRGKIAEVLVYLLGLLNGYEIEDVSEIPQYRYIGDFKVTLPSGRVAFLEVKNDSKIGSTRNILCEELNYDKDNYRFIDGNMHCNSDYFVVVSMDCHKIFVFDFKKIQQIYKLGQYREFNYPSQTTFCYLLPIFEAKRHNALIAEIDYFKQGGED